MSGQDDFWMHESMESRLQAALGRLQVVEAELAGNLAGTSLSVENPDGSKFVDASVTEEIAVSLVGDTKDSVANLLPANSMILGAVARVTEAIASTPFVAGDPLAEPPVPDTPAGVITGWKVGSVADDDGLVLAQATLDAGTIVVGTGALVNTLNGTAGKVRLTKVGDAATAGKVKVTVFYRQFTPATS